VGTKPNKSLNGQAPGPLARSRIFKENSRGPA